MVKLIKELSTDLTLEYDDKVYEFKITSNGSSDDPKVHIVLKNVDQGSLDMPFQIVKAIHDFVAEKWPVILVQE